MEKVDITVIGAGIIGLAVARELSFRHKNIFLIEQESSFGCGISSRNSEVIHAGIYYPTQSLKTRTCIEGRPLLYEFCRANGIPHKKTGKLIVANGPDEIEDLQKLFRQGLENGVNDLVLLD